MFCAASKYACICMHVYACMLAPRQRGMDMVCVLALLRMQGNIAKYGLLVFCMIVKQSGACIASVRGFAQSGHLLVNHRW